MDCSPRVLVLQDPQDPLGRLLAPSAPKQQAYKTQEGFGRNYMDMWLAYRQEGASAEPRRVTYLHLTSVNVKDAWKIANNAGGSHLALANRYLFFSTPVVNPYDDPDPT